MSTNLWEKGMGRAPQQERGVDAVPKARSQGPCSWFWALVGAEARGPHRRPAEPDVPGGDGEQSLSSPALRDWGP